MYLALLEVMRSCYWTAEHHTRKLKSLGKYSGLTSHDYISYCPTSVANSIYGGIPGASFDDASGLWNVPCNVEIDMALQFGFVITRLAPYVR